MVVGSFSPGQWLLLSQHELLLFAAAFFALGILDELALDCSFAWLRLTGRARTARIDEDAAFGGRGLEGRAAIFIAAWREAEVIGATIAHLLDAWPYRDLVVYVGCYRNDPQTIASLVAAARGDPRVRLVVNGRDGPTSKADCLNRLYRALLDDERRGGTGVRMVVLHDAEDMVDPAALAVLDQAMTQAEFVQLPVLALPQRMSGWVGSHYSDEFAEAHGKALVVRDALGAAIPGAGVGCAIARAALDLLADREGGKPFAESSLTEDYELGLKIAKGGGRGRFLRVRARDGRLIATRAFFPSQIETAVRQKTRWMHGIALQGWDRLGWDLAPVDVWMQLRDRRGPLAALLLAMAYALVLLSLSAWLLQLLGWLVLPPTPPLLDALLAINLAGLLYRCAVRGLFTGREYGWRQGVRAVPRVVVSNLVGILAGRRALLAYLQTLRGAPLVWDKTEHRDHPALMSDPGRPR